MSSKEKYEESAQITDNMQDGTNNKSNQEAHKSIKDEEEKRGEGETLDETQWKSWNMSQCEARLSNNPQDLLSNLQMARLQTEEKNFEQAENYLKIVKGMEQGDYKSDVFETEGDLLFKKGSGDESMFPSALEMYKKAENQDVED